MLAGHAGTTTHLGDYCRYMAHHGGVQAAYREFGAQDALDGERLVQVQRAPGDPFDFGRFELVEEPLPTP